MSDPNIGRKVSDRYELIETIGQGSMGKVYLAGDSLLGGVPVAVKFLSQTLLNENMRARFFTEAMTCAQLGQRSMHVVRVSDYGFNDDDIPFYVMEYLKGESVGRLVKKKPLPVSRFIGLTKQVLLGLRTAHNGILVEGEVVPIIHRDIKPSNILVISDPSIGELVKILDFGIAKLMQAGSEQTSTFMGTLAYASPEQMEGRELDGRSDIYSLGVMMYQMLSGKLPVKPTKNTFGSWYKVHRLARPKSLATFQPDLKIPADLEDIVMACLAKQREDRPTDIDEILKGLSAVEESVGSGFQTSQRVNATFTKLSISGKETQPVGRYGNDRDVIADAEALRTERRSLTEDESLIRDLEALLSDDDTPSSKEDSEAIAKQAELTKPEDAVYLQQSWPPEMPIAQIVFPKLVLPAQIQLSEPSLDITRQTASEERLSPEHLSLEHSSQQPAAPVPTLWAMMPKLEIEKRILNTQYNNFLCTMSPHPMVLWLTAFYSKSEGPRWLPCYLNLKDEISQKILWTLADAQHYRILFFTKEAPHQCIRLRKLAIATRQLKLFKEWATNAQRYRAGNPQESKAVLKRELEDNLKPKILMDLAAMHSDTTPGVGGSLSSQGSEA